jgi:hypothetical protein
LAAGAAIAVWAVVVAVMGWDGEFDAAIMAEGGPPGLRVLGIGGLLAAQHSSPP